MNTQSPFIICEVVEQRRRTLVSMVGAFILKRWPIELCGGGFILHCKSASLQSASNYHFYATLYVQKGV